MSIVQHGKAVHNTERLSCSKFRKTWSFPVVHKEEPREFQELGNDDVTETAKFCHPIINVYCEFSILATQPEAPAGSLKIMGFWVCPSCGAYLAVHSCAKDFGGWSKYGTLTGKE